MKSSAILILTVLIVDLHASTNFCANGVLSENGNICCAGGCTGSDGNPKCGGSGCKTGCCQGAITESETYCKTAEDTVCLVPVFEPEVDKPKAYVLNGQIISEPTKAGVRCCSDDGTSCGSDDPPLTSCHSDKTYDQAEILCGVQGYRLCTTSEMDSHCGGTGCNFDSAPIWIKFRDYTLKLDISTAKLSSTYNVETGFNASNCIDHDETTMCHGGNAAGDVLTLNLAVVSKITQIKIVNRPGESLQKRISGGIVKVSGKVVQTITCNVANNYCKDIVIYVNHVTGQTISIESVDNYLNLMEVYVYGQVMDGDHHWDSGLWSTCPSDCGQLIGDYKQTRDVVCKFEDGSVVIDAACSLVKPAEIKNCPATEFCEYKKYNSRACGNALLNPSVVDKSEAADFCNHDSECAGYQVSSKWERPKFFKLPSTGSNCNDNVDWTVYAKPIKTMLYSNCWFDKKPDDSHCQQYNENMVCARAGHNGRSFGGCKSDYSGPGTDKHCCVSNTEVEECHLGEIKSIHVMAETSQYTKGNQKICFKFKGSDEKCVKFNGKEYEGYTDWRTFKDFKDKDSCDFEYSKLKGAHSDGWKVSKIIIVLEDDNGNRVVPVHTSVNKFIDSTCGSDSLNIWCFKEWKLQTRSLSTWKYINFDTVNHEKISNVLVIAETDSNSGSGSHSGFTLHIDAETNVDAKSPDSSVDNQRGGLSDWCKFPDEFKGLTVGKINNIDVINDGGDGWAYDKLIVIVQSEDGTHLVPVFHSPMGTKEWAGEGKLDLVDGWNHYPGCPAGWSSNKQTLSGCSMCGPGLISKKGGMDKCSACAPGTYNPFVGATSCQSCPKDYSTNKSGAIECQPNPCNRVTHCNDHGTTSDNDFSDGCTCVCESGWSGLQCQKPVSFCPNTCYEYTGQDSCERSHVGDCGNCYWHDDIIGCLEKEEYVVSLETVIDYDVEDITYGDLEITQHRFLFSNFDDKQVTIKDVGLSTDYEKKDSVIDDSSTVENNDSKKTYKEFEESIKKNTNEIKKVIGTTTALTVENTTKVTASLEATATASYEQGDKSTMGEKKVTGSATAKTSLDNTWKSSASETLTTNNSEINKLEQTNSFNVSEGQENSWGHKKESRISDKWSEEESTTVACNLSELVVDGLESKEVVFSLETGSFTVALKVNMVATTNRGTKRTVTLNSTRRVQQHSTECSITVLPGKFVTEMMPCNMLVDAVTNFSGINYYLPQCAEPPHLYEPLQTSWTQKWCSSSDGSRDISSIVLFDVEQEATRAGPLVRHFDRQPLTCEYKLDEHRMCTDQVREIKFDMDVTSKDEVYLTNYKFKTLTHSKCPMDVGKQAILKYVVEPKTAVLVTLSSDKFELYGKLGKGHRCPGTPVETNEENGCGSEIIEMINDGYKQVVYHITVSTNTNNRDDTFSVETLARKIVPNYYAGMDTTTMPLAMCQFTPQTPIRLVESVSTRIYKPDVLDHTDTELHLYNKLQKEFVSTRDDQFWCDYYMNEDQHHYCEYHMHYVSEDEQIPVSKICSTCGMCIHS